MCHLMKRIKKFIEKVEQNWKKSRNVVVGDIYSECFIFLYFPFSVHSLTQNRNTIVSHVLGFPAGWLVFPPAPPLHPGDTHATRLLHSLHPISHALKSYPDICVHRYTRLQGLSGDFFPPSHKYEVMLGKHFCILSTVGQRGSLPGPPPAPGWPRSVRPLYYFRSPRGSWRPLH